MLQASNGGRGAPSHRGDRRSAKATPLGAGTACFFLERMSVVNGTRQEHTFIV